jgi:hypothetical protein
MRNPSDFEERKILSLRPEDRSEAAILQVSFDLVAAAVVEWDGVTYDHLLADGDDTPLACNPDTVRMLLEARTDILDALTAAVGEHRKGLRAHREETLGN